MPRSLSAMLCLIALGGCVDREAVDAVLGPEGEVGETPAFLPVGTLEALEASLPEDLREPDEALQARAETLQAAPARIARENDAELRARAEALRARAAEITP